MSAALAAWAAVALGLGGMIVRDARRSGKLEAILERLTELVDDHEDRIRDIERRPRSPRRERGRHRADRADY